MSSETAMSKTAALKQASDEITMYQMGSDWMVRCYDPEVNAYCEGQTRPYFAALETRTTWRAERAAELMGIEPGQAGELRGSARERLDYMIEAANR